MKGNAVKALVLMSSLSLAFASGAVLAQSTGTSPDANAPKADAKAEAKAKKKAQFSETQKSMQKESTSTASGAAPGASTDKSTAKNRPGGTAGMQSQMDVQQFKGSKPVDKTAKAPPRPNASKMTPEERAKYREETVKESKP